MLDRVLELFSIRPDYDLDNRNTVIDALQDVLLSDLLFILSLVNLVIIPVPGPYKKVWLFAYFLFMLEIVIALSREKADSPLNILLIAVSYFTYCQLWILVVLKAAYEDFVLKREHVWVKTLRYKTP